MAETGFRYFLYSSTQLKERTNIEKQVGRTFVPGTVSVGPKVKKFTELSETGQSRYSDAVIVTKGEVEKMSWTPIKSLK
jgi:hypothetical protein